VYLTSQQSTGPDGVAVVRDVLQYLPASRLPALDVSMRSWKRYGKAWWTVDPETVGQVSAGGGDALPLLALTSMHPDGRVREQAVRALAQHWTGDELRWLLLRAADWVEQVREAAAEAVRARALDPARSAPYAGPLAAAITLLETSRYAARLTTGLGMALLESIKDAGHRPGLRAASRSADPRTRRASVRLLVQVEDPLGLLRLRATAGDIVATSVAARAALADPRRGEEAARLLARAPYASIRQEALSHLVAHGQLQEAELGSALVDPVAGVRAVGQFALTKQGGDPLRWYRQRLEPDPRGALLGLGDLGTADDVPLALPYTNDQRAVVRAAAVRAVARHDDGSHVPLLIDIALSDTGRVAREAIRGLTRQGVRREAANQGWAAYEGMRPPRAAQRLLAGVLPHADRWTALRYGLLAAADAGASAEGVRLLRRLLTQWNHSFTAPSNADLAQLQRYLTAARSLLGEDDRAVVEEYQAILALKW
jgi:hypothetical protein